jgi:hypothetical protein
MSSHAQRVSSQRPETALQAEAEALARTLFERAYRDDTFDDLKHRAAFDRQEAGRLRQWLKAARAILEEGDLPPPFAGQQGVPQEARREAVSRPSKT